MKQLMLAACVALWTAFSAMGANAYPSGTLPYVTIDPTTELAVKIGEGVTTTAPTVAIAFVDEQATTQVSGNAFVSFTSSYALGLASPAADTMRKVSSIVICNIDTVTHTFYVNVAPTGTPGTITAGIVNAYSLAAGGTVTFSGGSATIGLPLPLPVTVPNGGTGQTSLTSGAFVTGNGTGVVALVGPGSAGQIPVSSGTAPVMKSLSGDVSSVAASGAVTFSATNTNLTTLANVTTVGTITSGTWSATIVTPTFGGTGANNATPASGTFLRGNGTNFVTSTPTIPNAFTQGDIVTATGANTLGSIAASATTGVFLRGAGASTVPVWSSITIPNSLNGGRQIISSSTTAISETNGYQSITHANTPYTVTSSDCESVIGADASGGALVINLPALGSTNNGFRITIINIGASGSPTVAPNGTDKISGTNVTHTLNAKYSVMTLRSTGTNNTNDGWEVEHAVDYLSATSSGLVNYTAGSGTATSQGNVVLTPGEWDVSLGFTWLSGTTGTEMDMAISANNNSLAGTVYGDSRVESSALTGGGTGTANGALPAFKVTVTAASTTYYAVSSATYTGTPQLGWRMSARRVR